MVNPVPPVLRDLPQTIETERLLMRTPRAGDGLSVHEAVMESLEELLPYMGWAHVEQSSPLASSVRNTSHSNWRLNSKAR